MAVGPSYSVLSNSVSVVINSIGYVYVTKVDFK